MRMIKDFVLWLIHCAGYELHWRDGHHPRKPAPEAPVVEVLPISDIPWPTIDLQRSTNPVADIMGSPIFQSTAAYFGANPASTRSLVSGDSQALLFSLIRNLNAQFVVEIGSFRCGTAEAICRALHANKAGDLVTLDPFGADTVPGILACWPPELREHIQFIPENSAAYFDLMDKQERHPDLVFVDGNHDYEYALFDIQCAGRRLKPGGFICIDNISQSGPFFAARDFLKANAGWTECGTSAGNFNATKAFDRERTGIHNTDMMVIRAPSTFAIGARPITPGETRWFSNAVQGVQLSLAPGARSGLLHVQCVVRGFSATEQVELTGEVSVALDAGATTVSARLEPAVELEGEFIQIRVEPWLIWQGETPLQLIEPPSII